MLLEFLLIPRGAICYIFCYITSLLYPLKLATAFFFIFKFLDYNFNLAHLCVCLRNHETQPALMVNFLVIVCLSQVKTMALLGSGMVCAKAVLNKPLLSKVL